MRRALPLLLLASCSTPQMQASLLYGPLDAKGDISITDTSGVVPVRASESLGDLGVDGEEGTFGARADFKWGLPHLTLMTQQSSWDGSGSVDADFGGINVPGASLAVDSELDLALHRALLTFDLAPTDMFELGVGFGLSVIDIQASATDQGDPNNRESLDELVPVPVLALRAGARLWRFDLEALVSGLAVDVGGDEATYLEYDFCARYAFFGEHGSLHGALVLGWRALDLQVEYDDGNEDYDLDLQFGGPYFGLQFGI